MLCSTTAQRRPHTVCIPIIYSCNLLDGRKEQSSTARFWRCCSKLGVIFHNSPLPPAVLNLFLLETQMDTNGDHQQRTADLEALNNKASSTSPRVTTIPQVHSALRISKVIFVQTPNTFHHAPVCWALCGMVVAHQHHNCPCLLNYQQRKDERANAESSVHRDEYETDTNMYRAPDLAGLLCPLVTTTPKNEHPRPGQDGRASTELSPD